MRTLLLSLSVALALAGCSSSEQGVDSQTSANSAAALAAAKPSPKPVAAAARPAFASMPDRGELIRFDVISRPTRQGSHTNYPIHISEAHALNAVREGGEIQMPTPSGETLRIAYQKHIEHKDGNWTWVGKTEDGMQALFTFGAKAAFGYIAQKSGEALRVTVADGRAWLVDVDASKVKDGNLLRGDEPDFLVPPEQAVAALERKRSAAAAAPAAAGDLPANASNTVDVVLGYTNGMVTKFGGVEAANTRLIAILDLTNAGYEISGIAPRVRLVRTVQVNYTDTNSNDTALEALTGVTCNPGCVSQPVPAELQPLRNARETYGGDLVSLVRPFRAPEHDSCGIAWLLGGGGFTIDNTDAPYGYSVVSDGTDVDEGDGLTYFCREQTLAHELGHNMGQQHNIEDSGGDTGTHSYSYGYREASTTGFYTVMAYRQSNSSQFSINNFANPSVNYSGRPTGTATADNARSLNQSMLLIVPFRGQVVPFDNGNSRNDFNGDGRSDITLWSASSSYHATWAMNGGSITSFGGFNINSGQSPQSSGFPVVQPQATLLAANTSSRVLYNYVWNGSSFAQNTVGGYPAGWQAIGQGDVNGDGKDDTLLRNPTSGEFAIWFMDGSVYQGSWAYAPPATYTVTGIADFNGDGRADLLWNDPGTRNASIWLSTGNAGFDIRIIGQYGATWNMVGAADVTGDFKADVILRSTDGVYLAYWRMDGAVYQSASAFGINNRQFHTTGDYNGDGIEDLLITDNTTNRNMWVWQSNGSVFTQYTVGQYGSGWTLLK